MTLTDDYIIQGEVNNNRIMLDLSDRYTGIGINLTTFEVYTLNTIIESTKIYLSTIMVLLFGNRALMKISSEIRGKSSLLINASLLNLMAS
jgi:hypothetical protein